MFIINSLADYLTCGPFLVFREASNYTPSSFTFRHFRNEYGMCLRNRSDTYLVANSLNNGKHIQHFLSGVFRKLWDSFLVFWMFSQKHKLRTHFTDFTASLHVVQFHKSAELAMQAISLGTFFFFFFLLSRKAPPYRRRLNFEPRWSTLMTEPWNRTHRFHYVSPLGAHFTCTAQWVTDERFRCFESGPTYCGIFRPDSPGTNEDWWHLQGRGILSCRNDLVGPPNELRLSSESRSSSEGLGGPWLPWVV